MAGSTHPHRGAPTGTGHRQTHGQSPARPCRSALPPPTQSSFLMSRTTGPTILRGRGHHQAPAARSANCAERLAVRRRPTEDQELREPEAVPSSGAAASPLADKESRDPRLRNPRFKSASLTFGLSADEACSRSNRMPGSCAAGVSCTGCLCRQTDSNDTCAPVGSPSQGGQLSSGLLPGGRRLQCWLLPYGLCALRRQEAAAPGKLPRIGAAALPCSPGQKAPAMRRTLNRDHA